MGLFASGVERFRRMHFRQVGRERSPRGINLAPLSICGTQYTDTVRGPAARLQPLKVGIQHFAEHWPEADLGSPAQRLQGLGRVAQQCVHVCRPVEREVNHQMMMHIQAGIPKGDFTNIPHRANAPGRYHESDGLALLVDQLHGPHIVAGVAPLALSVEVTKTKFRAEATLDSRHGVDGLPSDERQPARGAFIVEENARRGVQAEAFAGIGRRSVAK